MSLINPDLITYITKIQTEKEKDAQQNNGTNLISLQKQPTQKYNTNAFNVIMNENLNVDKTKRSQAKKGLLYLLNNLSGGSFCPEINTYFDEMKELKLNELRNNFKQQQLRAKREKKENKKYPYKGNAMDYKPIDKENYIQSFKKRPKPNEPFKDIASFKEFKHDLTQEELKEMYPEQQLNNVGFKFSKERTERMKLFGNNKKGSKDQKENKNEDKDLLDDELEQITDDEEASL